MATVLFTTADAPHVPLPLRQFDAEEFMAMAEAGVFETARNVELIGGYFVDMSPSGSDHNYVVMRFNELFAPLLGQLKLWVQGTLRVDDRHVFDPDFMLLNARKNSYKDSYPTAADVALLVEVSGSSLERDAKVKLPVYSAAGIPEFWIADLARETVIVHRRPAGSAYGEVREYGGDATLSPLAAPDLLVTAGEIFR